MKKWIFILLCLFLSGCQHTKPATTMNNVPGFPPGHELNPLSTENPPVEDQGINPETPFGLNKNQAIYR